jgi:hypothetical protein
MSKNQQIQSSITSHESESTFLEAVWAELADSNSAEQRLLLHGRLALFVDLASGERVMQVRRAWCEDFAKVGADLLHILVKQLPQGSEPTIEIRYDRREGASCQNLWPAFAEAIAKAVISTSTFSEAGRSIRKTLEEWAEWWPTKSNAAKKNLIGLFAEMQFLLLLADRSSSEAAIAAWHGPYSADHDFGISGVGFEVKAKATGKVMISNLHQLDDAGLNALYLVCVGLRSLPKTDTKHSLFELGELVTKQLAVSKEADRRLAVTMAKAGWHKIPEKQKRETCYRLTGIKFLHVRAGFPRILDKDKNGNMEKTREVQFPAGVGITNYTVDLAFCSDFIVPESKEQEIFTSLRKSK